MEAAAAGGAVGTTAEEKAAGPTAAAEEKATGPTAAAEVKEVSSAAAREENPAGPTDN